MGGISLERDVSLRSGQFVFNQLKCAGYDVQEIDVNATFLDDIPFLKTFDVFYNTLHGSFGEDGHLQGILEFLKIPYTGESLLQSSLAFNKLFCKVALSGFQKKIEAKKIPFALAHDFKLSALKPSSNSKNLLEEALSNQIRFPFFLKKIESGSSIGVHLVPDERVFEELCREVNLEKYLGDYYLENKIEGREITLGVYQEKNELKVLPILEIKKSA